jgi:hypothetical protein
MTCADDVPLGTVGDRSGPTVCGPNLDQARLARGGSGAPRRGPCLTRWTPAGCPRQANPPGNRLARGSPGGVWARDIPPV